MPNSSCIRGSANDRKYHAHSTSRYLGWVTWKAMPVAMYPFFRDDCSVVAFSLMCRQIKQGTKVELPLWLAEMLAVRYEATFLRVPLNIVHLTVTILLFGYIDGFLPLRCFLYTGVNRISREHYALRQNIDASLTHCPFKHCSPELPIPILQFH